MGSFLCSGLYTCLCRKVPLQAIYGAKGTYRVLWGQRGGGVLCSYESVADIKKWGGVARVGFCQPNDTFIVISPTFGTDVLYNIIP